MKVSINIRKTDLQELKMLHLTDMIWGDAPVQYHDDYTKCSCAVARIIRKLDAKKRK